MCPAPARDPAVHPQPHSRCSTRISACSTGRASENSCPQNSLLGRARGPALSDAQSIRESVSPVDSPPERACRTSPGIALPHAALPLLPRSLAHASAIPATRPIRSLQARAARQNCWDTTAFGFLGPGRKSHRFRTRKSLCAGESESRYSTQTTSRPCGTACLFRSASRLLLCAFRRRPQAAAQAALPTESRRDLSGKDSASYRCRLFPAPARPCCDSLVRTPSRSRRLAPHRLPRRRASAGRWTQTPRRHGPPRECRCQPIRFVPASRLGHSSSSGRAAADASRARRHTTRRAVLLCPTRWCTNPT